MAVVTAPTLHGRDGLHDLRLHLGEAGIAADICRPHDCVDAHVQHDLAARARSPRDLHAGLTGGDDEDIRLAARPAVLFRCGCGRWSHGRVLGEQQGDRLADDETAAITTTRSPFMGTL